LGPRVDAERKQCDRAQREETQLSTHGAFLLSGMLRATLPPSEKNGKMSSSWRFVPISDFSMRRGVAHG
jgi:hypothetical protein